MTMYPPRQPVGLVGAAGWAWFPPLFYKLGTQIFANRAPHFQRGSLPSRPHFLEIRTIGGPGAGRGG